MSSSIRSDLRDFSRGSTDASTLAKYDVVTEDAGIILTDDAVNTLMSETQEV